MTDVIRVGIADDHLLFRKGVIQAMRPYPNVHFVLEAQNGVELLHKIPLEKPEIILCDLKMPLKDGIEATKTIAELYPHIRVIMLTIYEDDRFVSHLMDCGAAGYLLKNAEPLEIFKAIVDVRRTGFYLTPYVNKILLRKTHKKNIVVPNLESEAVVSDKEKQILSLMAMEFTATEIATKMNASTRTVEAIKDRLMERFGAKNSVGLIFFAMKNGLIEY